MNPTDHGHLSPRSTDPAHTLTRRRTLGLSLALLATLQAGCSTTGERPARVTKSGIPTGSDAPIKQLTWGVSSGPRSLDSQRAFDGRSWVVWGELAEPLVTVNNAGDLVPKLATSWKQPTPTTITFTLRSNVRFWNGDPLTAEDVVWSLKRTGDPKVASEFAAVFWDNIASIRATADDEIIIKLKRPDASLIYYLRFPMIYQKAHAEKAGNDFGGPTGLIMATGPYKVTSFSPATGATMTRFDGYWGKKPTVERIDIKVIPEPETLRLAIQSGDVDGTFGIPLDSAPDWDALGSAQVIYGTSFQSMLLILDTSKPPFNDIHARRAIAYALDRPGLVRALLHDHGSPAKSISAPLLWTNIASQSEVDRFFSGLPDLPFDMAKAKSELSQSATPNGFPLTVVAPSANPEFAKVLETLKENVKTLGIVMSIKNQPNATWFDGLRGPKKNPMGIVTFGSTAPDPVSLAKDLVTGSGKAGGYTAYAPPEMLALLNESKSATPERRLEIAKLVVAKLSEDLPFVPVYTQGYAMVLNKKYVYTEKVSSWIPVADEWAHSIKAAR